MSSAFHTWCDDRFFTAQQEMYINVDKEALHLLVGDSLVHPGRRNQQEEASEGSPRVASERNQSAAVHQHQEGNLQVVRSQRAAASYQEELLRSQQEEACLA